MAIKFEIQRSEALEPYTNPHACEATAEAELFSEYGNTGIAGVEISCGKCNLHQRFGSAGSQQEISASIQDEVARIVEKDCLKLQLSGQSAPAELLPQVKIL